MSQSYFYNIMYNLLPHNPKRALSLKPLQRKTISRQLKVDAAKKSVKWLILSTKQ